MNRDDQSYGGLVLFGAPNRKQRLARRRLVVVSSVVALASAAWLFGALTRAAAPAVEQASYFSYE